MLFVSLAQLDIPLNLPSGVEGLELRVDLLDTLNLEAIDRFLKAAPLPVMITLRKSSQGGMFRGSEEAREKAILQLLSLSPPFFDLEGEMRPSFIRAVQKEFCKTQWILSYHNFEKTPDNLEAIYHSLSQYSPFACKIAAMAQSTNDALRLLLFARRHPKVSAICMGEKGEFGRALGKIMGNPIDYAVLRGSPSTAPGQMSAEDLIEIYRYPTLNQETAIYGLIGDPIAKSRGHIHHNAVFQKRNVNALYIKMSVLPDELDSFIGYAKEIGMRGLSVTIPLKEKMIPFLDEIDEKTARIGAVNTLRFEEGKIYGINTDGLGALNAIEKKQRVAGKKIVLIGAGGAARGIAFEAIERKANIVILNRTLDRAKALALAVNGTFGGLDKVPMDADILINCTPDSMPIDPSQIPPSALVMDIVASPRETLFLKAAIERGCHVVYGEEMFLNQAEAQTKFWLEENP